MQHQTHRQAGTGFPQCQSHIWPVMHFNQIRAHGPDKGRHPGHIALNPAEGPKDRDHRRKPHPRKRLPGRGKPRHSFRALRHPPHQQRDGSGLT